MRTRTIFQRSLSLLWAAALAVSLLVPVSAAEPERLLPQSNTFDMSSRHVGVVDSSGKLWMWGSNDCGQLGNDQAYNLFQPSQAAILERPFQTYPVQVLPAGDLDGGTNLYDAVHSGHFAALRVL